MRERENRTVVHWRGSEEEVREELEGAPENKSRGRRSSKPAAAQEGRCGGERELLGSVGKMRSKRSLPTRALKGNSPEPHERHYVAPQSEGSSYPIYQSQEH